MMKYWIFILSFFCLQHVSALELPRLYSDNMVFSKEIPAPIAVRYCWLDYPENPSQLLYNSAGLPASPFTSDCDAHYSAAELK